MEWIIENWKVVLVIAGGIGVIALIGFGFYGFFSGAVFSDMPVKNWTNSEAIFYGSVLIALAIFLSK